jgi:hypothetical protein
MQTLPKTSPPPPCHLSSRGCANGQLGSASGWLNGAGADLEILVHGLVLAAHYYQKQRLQGRDGEAVAFRPGRHCRTSRLIGGGFDGRRRLAGVAWPSALAVLPGKDVLNGCAVKAIHAQVRDRARARSRLQGTDLSSSRGRIRKTGIAVPEWTARRSAPRVGRSGRRIRCFMGAFLSRVNLDVGLLFCEAVMISSAPVLSCVEDIIAPPSLSSTIGPTT